jgi:hypothetical protein
MLGIAVLVFVAVFGLHFGFITWQQAQVAAQWVRVAGTREASAWARYVEHGDYWIGYSYALAAAFTAIALALTIRQRRQAAAGLVGGVTLLGVLYGAGCFLIGCCGSPMLVVYLSLFGPSVLGLLKPLVAIITTLSVVVSTALIIRRARAHACAGCAPTLSARP